MNSPKFIHLLGAFSSCIYAVLVTQSRMSHDMNLVIYFGCLFSLWAAVLGVFFLCSKHEQFSLKNIVFWGLIFRAISLFGAPILEDDFYRYLWDGRLFIETLNPYNSVPANFFLDQSLPQTFMVILDHINHPDSATFYGPVCIYLFGIGYLLDPGQLLPIQIILTLVDILTLWTLYRLLAPKQHSGLILYSWCPLLIQETTFTAHPDILGVLFLVLALASWNKKKAFLAGICIAFSVATRPMGILLAPLFFLTLQRKTIFSATFLSTLTLLYLPFWAQGSSGGIFEMLAFSRNWEFNSSVFALISLVTGTLTAKILTLGIFLVFLVIYLKRYSRSNERNIPRGDLVYGMFFLLSPVLNPWYMLWLLPFVVIYPRFWNITALVVVSLSYLHGLYLPQPGLSAYDHPLWLRPVEFGLIGIALAATWWVQKKADLKPGL